MAGAAPVAVVGMAVLLPGARDLDAYWRNLVQGRDAVTEVPAGRWDPEYYAPGAASGAPDRVYCRRGGFVDDIAEVDVVRFGIMPASVAGTEPDQLIALHVAAAALADAGGEERLPDRDRVGVVLGRGGYLTPGLARLDQRVRTARQLTRTLAELLPELGADRLEQVRRAFTERLGPDRPEAAIGLVPNLAASRVANRLDLRGPAYTVDAACASSLVAVDQAVGELASGRCDVMLAGGTHHCHDITLWSVFAQLGALSPSQRSRPFHRDADGILIGEGTGVVVLKRLDDALRDGDRVYAVIRGTGVAGDGRAAGLVNPDPGGQARAVRRAWAAAGLDPREPGSLGLLEAHGTATPAGDTAELATLAEVFGPAGGAGGRAVIGSVKSMIGHTMPAAGVAGLVKAALALHHGTLLPTLHCDDPHPGLAATRFRALAAAEPWRVPPGGVRRAAVNAFGFGGINAHVVLEEPPGAPAPAGRPRVTVTEPERALTLAADGPERLAALLAADDSALLARGADPGHPGPVRLGVVDPTPKRLALARRVVARGGPWRGRNDVWFAPRPLLGGGGRLAFLFPGLESEFAPRLDGVAEYFGLPRLDGADARVGDVGRHGVGVFAVGRLLDAALRRMGVRPDAVAGHSVGEWTAMAAGGLYAGEEVDAFLASFDPDALHVPGVVFAALGAPAERVAARLAEHPGVVLSHDNAPSQCMVCGPRQAVEEFVRAMRADGVIAQVLPFQSGFHTPMLAPCLAPIRAAAERFRLRPPRVPVWSATTAAPYPEAEADVRELFVRHLLEPVRFRPLTEAMHAAGFRAFVVVGTGQLASLVGDTLGAREHLAVAANTPHRDGLAQLRRVAVALWADGARVDPALPRPGSARRGGAAPARLDLGGALIGLDGPRLAELRDALRPAPAAGPGTGLDALAGSSPLAAELGALLRETAGTAAELIAAGAGQGRAAPPPSPPPSPQPPSPQPSPPGGRTVLRVSTADMPHLRDHCFFPQRADWPDEADRWPVVPATTIVAHLMEAAERDAPGLRAVAVRDAGFGQWVTASPPVDVPVTVTPAPDGRRVAEFGRAARATVELAPAWPAPPAPWRAGPGERAPEHTAADLYRERWMFHGPAFRGVTALTGIGEAHVRGVLTVPPAPGALLDNVGQLLGYWIMATRAERTVVFPVGMRHLRFFGPHPAPGTAVECLVRIVSLDATTLEAEAQLVVDGTVWAELTGWRDRRFDSHPETRPVERFPERNTLSRPRSGGWVLVHERWSDLASRELIMRNHLGGPEREAYQRHPPRGRRQFLLGRIAAKDAVRRWLWAHGAGPVFPAEVRIGNDGSGRPYAVGVHGRALPPLDLTLAHRAEAAVALVVPRPAGREAGGPGPGIDIEEVRELDPATLAVAFGPEELALLDRVCAAEGGGRARWTAAFWAAKEAAAKAEGTGFLGRPRAFAVEAAEPGRLVVRAPGPARRRHALRAVWTANPPGLPEREYAVAWTPGAAHDDEENTGDKS
ncbi:type I polyketide synthase [Streptomyces capparidis]